MKKYIIGWKQINSFVYQERWELIFLKKFGHTEVWQYIDDGKCSIMFNGFAEFSKFTDINAAKLNIETKAKEAGFKFIPDHLKTLL